MTHEIYVINNDKKQIEDLKKSFIKESDEYNFFSINASDRSGFEKYPCNDYY